MACIKSVNRSSFVALSPTEQFLAAGTVAGAVDQSFSSASSLEIFKIDLQSDDRDLPLVGTVLTSERFNRLAWGRNGSQSDEFSSGLIAGGLVDGSIDVWNPKDLICSESSDNALVGHLSSHKGPVRGLEFNSFTPNLLASGADDGEVCIWDLAVPAEPSRFPPLKGSGSSAQGEISYVSWNCKVQHILATASLNGVTVVWDLKKQKPVISVEDSIRRRCSVLQWHPDVATQLVIASDDDSFPALRLWDMRNTMAPVREFVGHNKGVIGMSWCPNDSSYLLTCSKDGRTICWNTVNGEIARELPVGTKWNFDVHWYSKIPGVITTCSFDGKIGIYNIEGCSRYGVLESEVGSTTLKAPKWYKCPAGTSFGFGGKLVSFNPTTSVSSNSVSDVFLHDLASECSINFPSDFESAIRFGDKSLLKSLCERKSKDSELDVDRETWGFLKVMFEEDGTARGKMLAHLGFEVPAVEEHADTTLSHEIEHVRLDDDGTEDKGAWAFSVDDGEDFFNNLPSPKIGTPKLTLSHELSFGGAITGDETLQESIRIEDATEQSFDEIIQHSLVVGNYKEAVQHCIAANKMADALVMSHLGGTSLWERTRNKYLKMSHSPYMKIVSALVNNDLMMVVNTRSLKYWKETLALLCTFAHNEEWNLLCNSLASRLAAAGNSSAATLCYICAGNVDKTFEIWSKGLAIKREGKTIYDLFQDLMEKTIALVMASGQTHFSTSLSGFIGKYAEILASQGHSTTAREYLKLLSAEELSSEHLVLRDHIACSIEPEKGATAIGVGNTQQQMGSAYSSKLTNYNVADNSRHVYQETAVSLSRPSVPDNPYAEHYQKPAGSAYVDHYQQPALSSFGTGYSAPPAPQPVPQSLVFLPPQASHTNQNQTHFVPQTSATQQSVKPFVPSSVPVLRNADQYQQPTLGSHLHPGSVNAIHPSVPPHSSVPRATLGPASNFGAVQRPGISHVHPLSPTKSVVPQSTAAAPPPPLTVQTANTTNVSAHHKPIVVTLTRLFNETSETLGGTRANTAKKREIDDNSRKLGALFAKLNTGDLSPNASDKLVRLCGALDSNDFAAALNLQVLLTTTEWDECSFWLPMLKRMIKTKQSTVLRPS